MISTNALVIGNVPRADCDPSGFAHHSRIIEWCERARVSILRANGVTIDIAEAHGYLIVTGKITAEYKSPIRPDEMVFVRTEVDHINTLKIRTHHEICRSDEKGGDVVCACITITSLFLGLDFIPKQLPESAWYGNWDSRGDYSDTVGA